MTSTLPIPDQAQVREVRSALAGWTRAANAALVDVDIPRYRNAMAEVRVCQSWIDTYVDRADRGRA